MAKQGSWERGWYQGPLRAFDMASGRVRDSVNAGAPAELETSTPTNIAEAGPGVQAST